jgi:colanic acid biosynthesis glycosyl transferase WcaI
MPSKERRRLWLVTELYFPEMTSTGYYLTRIGEGLADEFDVKVICGQPNYSARGTIAPKRETLNGVEIFRAAGTRLNRAYIPLRLINMITLGLSVFVKAVANFKRGDKVLAVTTPPNMPFIVAFASLIRGASYVPLIHDNYPEMLVAVGKTTEDSFLTTAMNFFNRWLYKHAAKIIVVGRDMKKLVERKTEGLDIPIATVPNWAELESVSPAPRDAAPLLGELGISDKLVLMYAGNLGFPNDLESIVDCARIIKDRLPVHMVFIGEGVKRKWLEQKVKELGLTNVTILDPRPRGEQMSFINSCDLGIVPLTSKMWGVSMPSRTYNLLAAGKPILALTEKDSEVDLVVKENDIGWSVPPNSPEKMALSIEDILERRDELAEMGNRARAAAEQQWNFETALEGYRTVLR